MGKVKKVTGIDVAAPVKAVQSGIKAIQNAPGISSISKGLTDVLQPVEKAVVQPIGRGLVSLDKAVGNAIPGGWGTIGTIAASMIPGGQFAALGLNKTAAMTGLGALTGSGVLRPGRSFNLQGALAGGAMAYGASKLADFAAAAGGGSPTVDAAGNLTTPVTTPGVPLVSEPPMGIMDSISKYAGDVGRSLTSSPSNLVQEPGIMDSIANSFSNAGRSISSFADAATTPSTYTDFGKAYAQNVSDIGSGIKNLITTPGAGKAAAAATGINPVGAAGATMFGATGLMALDEQEKLLNEQLANQQIAQAEYDQALGEINRQRDYAAKMVRENPFRLEQNTNYIPDRTVYERTDKDKNLYERSTGTLYAKGGDVKGYFGGGIMGSIGPRIEEIVSKLSPPVKAASPIPSRISYEDINRYNLGSTLYDNEGSVERSRLGIESLVKDNANRPQIPQGIIAPPPGAITTQALEAFYNPQTDEEFIAPTGGYIATPESGFMRGASPRLGRTNYQKNKRDSRLYAYGGSVDDEMGGDYTAMGMDHGNLQKGLFGMGYAAGGTPRFLSGGGDGMSDSIPATINEKQPARLADGEFVIPADVVSHLGNGSSKAGAKRLYSMMDRVRQERTGTKKQGKQINPRKFMPA